MRATAWGGGNCVESITPLNPPPSPLYATDGFHRDGFTGCLLSDRIVSTIASSYCHPTFKIGTRNVQNNVHCNFNKAGFSVYETCKDSPSFNIFGLRN